MSEAVIKVRGLAKQYRIGSKDSANGTFLQSVGNLITAPFKNFRRLSDLSRFDRNEDSIYWALKDIDFDLEQGSVLGVIGRNGAGKSTLLKILSRITEPTRGEIQIRGQVASLLEVGTGFHPELTGRENVYMNGTILGMRRREIDKKFDEIIDFSGIEKFIDTPVKFYSSGMKVRLGFAVAANLDPDVLVVDEVLAVGDIQFQQKCMGKMGEVVSKQGRTILFVSHNISAIKSLCTKGLLLESGEMKYFGDINEAVTNYFKSNQTSEGEFVPGRLSGDERVIVEGVTLENQFGVKTETFQIGDDLRVTLRLEALDDFENPNIGIVIKSNAGAVTVANTMIDGCVARSFKKGVNIVQCTFKRIPLLPKEYGLSVAIRGNDARTPLTSSKDIGYFAVVTKMKDLGIVGPDAELLAADSISPFIPYSWKFSDGQVHDFNILDRVRHRDQVKLIKN